MRMREKKSILYRHRLKWIIFNSTSTWAIILLSKYRRRSIKETNLYGILKYIASSAHLLSCLNFIESNFVCSLSFIQYYIKQFIHIQYTFTQYLYLLFGIFNGSLIRKTWYSSDLIKNKIKTQEQKFIIICIVYTYKFVI